MTIEPVIATAPGKVMLAGEYAVLDGSRAIVAAVDRRAVATTGARPSTSSGRTGRARPTAGAARPTAGAARPTAGAARPTVGIAPSEFLIAARHQIATVVGEAAAAAFDDLVVDTAALRDGDRKLGLGSSAAATVAAIGAALAAHAPEAFERDIGATRTTIARLAALAHADAQGPRGARGSGADIAASTYGGVIDFRRDLPPTSIHLAADLLLRFAWTGQPADTATLVAAVQAARATNRTAVERALTAIAEAAAALADATSAAAAIAAIADGDRAMTALADATGVPLVPSAVHDLAARLAPLAAAAKTTGAGGGDIVLVAAPATIDRKALDEAIRAAGLHPLALAVDPTGVDIRRTGA